MLVDAPVKTHSHDELVRQGQATICGGRLALHDLHSYAAIAEDRPVVRENGVAGLLDQRGATSGESAAGSYQPGPLGGVLVSGGRGGP